MERKEEFKIKVASFSMVIKTEYSMIIFEILQFINSIWQLSHPTRPEVNPSMSMVWRISAEPGVSWKTLESELLEVGKRLRFEIVSVTFEERAKDAGERHKSFSAEIEVIFMLFAMEMGEITEKFNELGSRYNVPPF